MAARFPSAIATDADLLRAYDRLAGELASNIDASTLSIPVVDGSAFSGAQNFSVTIEDEQILIASVSGNTLTAGQRGFAGTTAASHAAGALVRATATAYHHNAVADEVKALETALGTNMSNVVKNPVTEDVNANGHKVTGLGKVCVGPSPAELNPQPGANYVIISGTTERGYLEFHTWANAGEGVRVGQINFSDRTAVSPNHELATIHVRMHGTTPEARGGSMHFYTKPPSQPATERAYIDEYGRLHLLSVPTSPTGLSSGAIWRDAANGNVLKIVP